MTWLSSIFSFLGGVVSGPVTEWQKRKTQTIAHKAKLAEIEIETQLSIAQAKIELAKQGMIIESDWDSRAQENQKNSWKDEFVLIMFSIPFLISFLPAFIESYNIITKGGSVERIGLSIKTSWTNVALAPEWYQWILIGIVAGIYGLRWMVGFIKPNKNKIVDNFGINKNEKSKINLIKD